MKKIIISDDRKLNISNVVIGYLQENKIEKLEFEIPKEYENFGRKACFEANGNTFAKNFDNITGNTITLTRDITQYQDLFMTIAFFKIEDEDEIIARTSTLHILIQDAVICDDDIKPDEPKVIILDNLITKVTNLDNTVTKNEEIREANETTRQQNETTRQQNEINRVNSETNREKAEESRKKAELERVSNENTRQSNEEERKAAENERVSNENAREEYINNLKAQVDNGDFDGADFNYKWDGTKLGVKNSKETTYQFVELKGQKGDKGGKGDKGDTGNGIQNIDKVSTVGNVDTYAINYTDGTQTTFDVTNGEVTKEQLDEVDGRAKKTRDELERVKNDVLETGTDTDTYIHLEDSAMAEYQELSVDGVCEQETTTGSQEFNFDSCKKELNNSYGNVIFGTYNSFTIIRAKADDMLVILNLKENTKYYIKFNWSCSKGNQAISIEYSDGTIRTLTSDYSSSAKNGIVNFTTDETKTLTKLHFTIFSTDTNYIINNMIITTNSTATIEPYTGGQPSPSPDYPQPISTIENSLKITSCGKNLFDNSTTNDGHYITGTGTIGNGANDMYTDYIPITPNTNYYLSGRNNWGNYCLYDKDKMFLERIIGNVNGVINITNSLCRYIVINALIADKNTMQLEKGSIATEYEPYQETRVNIEIPEGEFIGKLDDTYKDTLKVEYNEEDGQYHLNLYKRVYKNNSYNGESYNYYISTTARKDGNIECGELQTGQVVYYGGDETIIDLGIVDQLITYNEITNLFTDSDLLPQINAKYYRNFISTVRNLQVNEKALKQELIDINNRLSALETAHTSTMSESEVVE